MKIAWLCACALGLAGCQATAPTVYLDPASNLGTPLAAAPPSPANPGPDGSLDAQGQPNSEFDERSWIDNHRAQSQAPVQPRPRQRLTGQADRVPLLQKPDRRELDPSMFDPEARR